MVPARTHIAHAVSISRLRRGCVPDADARRGLQALAAHRKCLESLDAFLGHVCDNHIGTREQTMMHTDSDGMKRKVPVRAELLISLCLCLLVLGVYWQVRSHEFTSFDDTIYVTQNDHVLSGLSPESLRWALSFDGKENTYWHPLTWMSHMLDVQIYGLRAGYHLTTNLIFHILNYHSALSDPESGHRSTMEECLCRSPVRAAPYQCRICRLGGGTEKCPEHLLSAADHLVLRALSERPSALRYAAVLFVFTIGLMAKPMLVTLPFLLLLVDYWPLGRFRLAGFNLITVSDRALTNETNGGLRSILNLIYEKIPLLALALIVAYLSVAGLKSGTIPFDHAPLLLRFENALVSYIRYLADDVLSHRPGLFLSISFRGTDMADHWVRSAAVGDNRCGSAWLNNPSLVCGGMVLVPGDPGAGYRHHAGRSLACGGGSLGLCSAYRSFHRHCLGRGKRGSTITLGTVWHMRQPGLSCWRSSRPVTHDQIGYWQDSTHLYRRGVQVTQT